MDGNDPKWVVYGIERSRPPDKICGILWRTLVLETNFITFAISQVMFAAKTANEENRSTAV